MAELLGGNITAVCGMTDIIVKQRKKLDSEEIAPVETDDYCSFICTMENGVKGNFLISRCARGKSNSIKFDIYGTNGVLCFDMNNPNVLGVCSGVVDVETESIHTVNVHQKFRTTQEQEFVKMLFGEKCEIFPTIEDGFRSQKILDAILESSEKRCWVDI